MRRFALTLAALALTLGVATPALAQTPTTDEAKVEADEGRIIDFTHVVIIGELERPSGVVVWGKPPVKFRNLIEMRANFRPELSRSASKLP